jgi:branched-subunit amino acid ABC-type transport system permease component
MTYLEFVLLGLASGAVYSLLGLGLVLEYRGSGVVNFAHGAMAMFIAYVFVDLRTNGNLLLPLPPILPDQIHLGAPLGTPASAVIALAYSAVLGFLAYFAIFRFLRHASALGRVVASVGLMLTLESLAVLQFGTSSQTAPPILPTTAVNLGGGLVIPQVGIDLTAIVIVVAAVLWGVFRFTRFGLATRAVAETEKGAVLLGLAPGPIAATNWVIATVLAGASGILLVQITALTPTNYTLLIVPALAVAFVGRFTSFWWALLAGFVLAVIQSEVSNLQSTWSWVPQGIQDAIPLVMLLVAIAVHGRVLPTRGMLVEARLPKVPAPRNLRFIVPASFVACVIALFALSGDDRLGLIVSLVTAFICLSFVVLTGYTGQISLAQLAFSGIGGFLTSRLATSAGLGFPLDVLIGGVAAMILGVLVGVPAQRARGVSLAVISLGIAAAMDSLVFGQNSINGGFAGSQFPALRFLGLNLDIRTSQVHAYPRPWFGVLVAVLLAAAGLSIANLRRTPTGRRMLAVRGNERAAAAVGIHVAGMKIYAFLLASLIAGIGGGLLGYQQGVLSETSFGTFVSVSFLAIAFIGGVGRVSGAVLAGLLLASGGLVATILNNAIDFGSYLGLVSGLGVLILPLVHPDGIAGTPPPPPIAALLRRLSRVSGATADAGEPASSAGPAASSTDNATANPVTGVK